jgi:diguanylate cyclase (GGDEF)-like protein
MSQQRPLGDLRREAVAAARGLTRSEHALVDALRAIREETGRAAEVYRAVVRSLALALEARDGYAGGHSDVVHALAVAVARRLGLDDRQVAEVQAVALLHDVGKIGIPDYVLHKPGPLDESEWELMRTHPLTGERILAPLPGFAGVATAVRHEHERWDGGGYPDGLAGEEIPLSSRIVLACDVYGALVSDRPYRRALAPAQARAELRRGAGSQFDPRVVDALLACLEEDATGGGPAGGAATFDLPVLLAPEGDGDALRLEREVHALITLASAVAAAHSLDEVIEVAAEEACRAVAAASLSVSRWETDRHALRTIINVGRLADWEERRPADELYRLDEDDALRLLLLEGRSYVTRLDDPDGFVLEQELLRRSGKHCCVAVPIVLGGSPWGELWAARDAGQPVFGEQDVRFLETVAGQIAAAVGRTELLARMAELAYTDPLTGAGNRRALEERLELAVAEARAAGTDVAVVLADLDRLKELNDAHGHQAGDDALRHLAAALGEAARELPTAAVFRIGGDEFCLLLEGVDAAGARVVAEKALVRLRASTELGLGCSCGVASLGLGAGRPADLLRAADAAQYAAKRLGRGRVCLPDPHPSATWRRTRALRAGRRGARDLPPLDVASLLARTLAALDGVLASAGALRRLEEVVALSCEALEASAGAVSFRASGNEAIETFFELDPRTGGTASRLLGMVGEVYVSSHYPATARLLERGGSFVLRADDEDADPAERRLLEEWGMTGLLAAAVAGDGGDWLVELYADSGSASLEAAEPAVRLLVAEAVARAQPERVTLHAASG